MPRGVKKTVSLDFGSAPTKKAVPKRTPVKRTPVKVVPKTTKAKVVAKTATKPKTTRKRKPSVSNKAYLALNKRKAEIDTQIKESVKAKGVIGEDADPVVEELTTQKLRSLNKQRGRRMLDNLKVVPEFTYDKDDLYDLSSSTYGYDLYGTIGGRGCTLQYTGENKLDCVTIYEVLREDVLENYRKTLAKIAKVTKQNCDNIEIRYATECGRKGFGSTVIFF